MDFWMKRAKRGSGTICLDFTNVDHRIRKGQMVPDPLVMVNGCVVQAHSKSSLFLW
jgi:hypothetical protein